MGGILVSQSFQCPNCSAPLDLPVGGGSLVTCLYCRSKVMLPVELQSDSMNAQDESAHLLKPDQVVKLSEISDLIAQGNKIGAIKLYREVFDTSLTEAKEAIEQLADGKPITQVNVLAEGEVLQPRNELLEAQIQQLVQDGKKIEAIKRYRETYHTGLKESKEAIEAYETGGVLPVPSLKISAETAQQMIDAIQNFAQSASVENTTISVQTGSFEVPARRASGASSSYGWWITCGIVFILLTVILPIFFAMTSRGGPLESIWARLNPFAYARIGTAFGEEGSGPGLFDDPRALAVDSGGNLYVANYSDGRIQKFDPSGEFSFLWSVGPNSYVNSLAADRFGNVFVVYQGEIWRYDGATGKPTGQVENPDDRWFEVIAASPDGSLVAAVNTEDVLRFDAEGHQVYSRAESGSTISRQADDVEDIAADAVGNIYILSYSSSAVLKYAPDGRLLTRFGSEGEEKGQFRYPQDIAVDGQGRIYVSDSDGIKVFASDGRYLDEFNVPGGVAFGIEFDNQGNLWVVTNKPQVLEYKLPGP